MICAGQGKIRMKHLFIVNPVAGKMKREEKLSKVRRAVEELPQELKKDSEFEIYETKAPLDACAKIRADAAECDELRVYAYGGDGTLNECVNGAAGFENVAVTHYPCGTGNDFIKTFGDDKQRFFDLRELIGGEVRKIDLVRCNDRYSVNICSVGIDARIGTEVHKYSSIPVIGGATGYVTSAMVNLFKGVNQPLAIDCAGRHFDGKFALVCICNGRYYGGGFNPVPTAMVDDGVLDVLIVNHVSRLQFLTLIGTYAKGQYKKMPHYITHVRGQSLSIDSETDLVVNLDGEAMNSRHIDIELIPGGLGFIFPANMDYFKNQTACPEEKRSKWEISVS